MGDLTCNFSRREFRCRCGCGLTDMNPAFIEKLQTLRSRYGRIMSPTSGIRCADHNRTQGGSPKSYHLFGRAADIAIVSSADRFDFVSCAIMCGFGGIGIGKGFVHVDDRPPDEARMWTYR